MTDGPGMVVHTCNPSTQETEAGQDAKPVGATEQDPISTASKEKEGAGEVAGRLRVLTALVEKLGSLPGTHTVAYNLLYLQFQRS